MQTASKKDAVKYIVEPQLQDAQCRFCPGRSTMDQIFGLQQVLENCAKEIYKCFVDLEKTIWLCSKRQAVDSTAGV